MPSESSDYTGSSGVSLGVDQSHPQDVSELSEDDALLLAGGHAGVFVLPGRGQLGLGEYPKLLSELQ